VSPKMEKIILYWPKGLRFWRQRVKYAEGDLLEGKRHGKWVFCYRSGQKQLEGQYAKGKKTGLWVKWAESGERLSEGGFQYDRMHGMWTDWHGNGQRALQSHWVMGKRDGKWTYWGANGSLKTMEHYDHRSEEDKGYSIHTDLEERQIMRKVQIDRVNRNWQGLVGKPVARLVKPWHVACWILIFIPIFALTRAGRPWRGAALAGMLAFLITSALAWGFDKKEHNGRGLR
jgi:hypothetical protein